MPCSIRLRVPAGSVQASRKPCSYLEIYLICFTLLIYDFLTHLALRKGQRSAICHVIPPQSCWELLSQSEWRLFSKERATHKQQSLWVKGEFPDQLIITSNLHLVNLCHANQSPGLNCWNNYIYVELLFTPYWLIPFSHVKSAKSIPVSCKCYYVTL